MSKKALPWLAALAAALVPGGGLVYYQASGGESCARCHEIRPAFDRWTDSAHRAIPCADCHGGLLTPELGFHAGNLRRLVRHLRDDVPQQILVLGWRDVGRIVGQCRRCHEREYAAWRAGPHATTYADIFLDAEHNRKRLLIDDCLRCHGMHFPGGIAGLVAPLATTGPWKLLVPEIADQPAIPCFACHQMHRQGAPLGRRAGRQERPPAAREAIMPPSLALFDRRTKVHLPVAAMPLPEVFEGERRVRLSPDRRQALCYQCHAPQATAQAASGDDRTALGVHEGFSCLACHAAHSQMTRASCAGCHPRWSNCGLDVETMDTTFKDRASRHDIHTVKCVDCHPKGVPPKRRQGEPHARIAGPLPGRSGSR
jgi:hypothetical protein